MAKFPPLPEPYQQEVYATSANTESVRKGFELGGYVKAPATFTADQLRARDLEIWRMAMEEAAAHCIKVGIRAFSPMQDDGARECAAAIRSLPEPSPSTDQADVSKSGAGIDMAATQDSGSGASI